MCLVFTLRLFVFFNLHLLRLTQAVIRYFWLMENKINEEEEVEEEEEEGEYKGIQGENRQQRSH